MQAAPHAQHRNKPPADVFKHFGIAFPTPMFRSDIAGTPNYARMAAAEVVNPYAARNDLRSMVQIIARALACSVPSTF
jgi:hypothetical protein